LQFENVLCCSTMAESCAPVKSARDGLVAPKFVSLNRALRNDVFSIFDLVSKTRLQLAPSSVASVRLAPDISLPVKSAAVRVRPVKLAPDRSSSRRSMP